jgi:two-component system response regulator DevR
MTSRRPSATPPITVYLLDDYGEVRTALRGLLGEQPDLVVVGEGGTATEALTQLPALRPQVALIDIGLPDGNGIDVCRQVRSQQPGINCLIMTSHDEEDALFAAVMAGAAGYLSKQLRFEDFLTGIRSAAVGQCFIEPSVVEELLARLATVDRLDGRGRAVAELVIRGRTNREIARELEMPEKAVRAQIVRAFTILSLERRRRAVTVG